MVENIILDTGRGEIAFEIDIARAPLTARNFLRYVDAGLYDGGCFYRVVGAGNDRTGIPIKVIQGGIGHESRAHPPIAIETTVTTGLSHVKGTLSMARMVPGWSTFLATSEFFVCLDDAPELDCGGRRNGDGQGFAAFGRVAGGMDILAAMHGLPTDPARMAETSFAGQMLRDPPRILRARRA